jgi:glycosyltransferase involved in cell wall biosynthesis
MSHLLGLRGRTSGRPLVSRLLPLERIRRPPLRVAMIHFSDFRLDSRVQRQARALAERGEEVDLVCLGEREELRVGAGTIRVHPVRAQKAHGGGGAYVRAYGSFIARALARVTALDARHRFDLVQAHNMPDAVVAAALAPRLRGTPLILDVHDTFPELFATKFARAPEDLWTRMLRLEERVCAALATHVIVVTEQARLHLEGRGVGVGRATVVMNSPDERVFGPPRPPVRWPLRGPLRLLYHGGLAERFGVESLIRAVGLLGARDGPDVRLRVCGAGEDRDRLAILARELAPGRVDVAREPVPFAEIPGELARAHIGVVPTLDDSFTELLLPVKLLEYVHMGLPVAASRLPGITGCFAEGDLRMFRAGDTEDLAGSLRELCADAARARERALSATQRLTGIAWERQRERYLALVDELTGSGSPSPADAGTSPVPAGAASNRASASAATRSASATMDSPLSSRG